MTAQTVPVAWQEQNKRRTTAYRSNSLGRTTWTTLRFAKVSGSGHVSSSSRLLLLYANVVNHCERKLIIRLYHLEKFSHQIKLELLLSLVTLFTMDNVAVPIKVEAYDSMTLRIYKF
jgi:hypothetical protein